VAQRERTSTFPAKQYMASASGQAMAWKTRRARPAMPVKAIVAAEGGAYVLIGAGLYFMIAKLAERIGAELSEVVQLKVGSLKELRDPITKGTQPVPQGIWYRHFRSFFTRTPSMTYDSLPKFHTILGAT
jgi:hypothetical protein